MLYRFDTWWTLNHGELFSPCQINCLLLEVIESPLIFQWPVGSCNTYFTWWEDFFHSPAVIYRITVKIIYPYMLNICAQNILLELTEDPSATFCARSVPREMLFSERYILLQGYIISDTILSGLFYLQHTDTYL